MWVDRLGSSDSKVDMPQVDMAAVLHLRRSYKGGYKLHIVQPEHEEFRWQQFLRALELYRLQQDSESKPMQVFYPPKGDGSQPLPMIEDVKELSRWAKSLASAGIENVGQLVHFTPAEINCIKRVGPKAVVACIEVLARYELALQSEVA